MSLHLTPETVLVDYFLSWCGAGRDPIRRNDESYLSIHTPDVLALIRRGDPSWEQMVPAAVAQIIKAENLFGWRPRRATSTT